MTANNQLNSIEYKITQKSEPAYSPISLGDKPIALNARMPTRVPPNNGQSVALTTSLMACSRGSPCCSLTNTPSVTTMALSTSIPSAMMSAPSDMRCIAISSINIIISVPATVSSKTKPIIKPERSPIKNSSTKNTITTAAMRLSTKLSTEAFTDSDCMEIIFSSMPTGR